MSTPAALSVKARHYQHLAGRLQALTATVDAARATIETAANQSMVMGELATFQASMFMASLAQVDEVAATSAAAEPSEA